MGHAKELITLGVYGDNSNIIPKEVPELLSYMEEVMPEKNGEKDLENETRDTLIDIEGFLAQGGQG